MLYLRLGISFVFHLVAAVSVWLLIDATNKVSSGGVYTIVLIVFLGYLAIRMFLVIRAAYRYRHSTAERFFSVRGSGGRICAHNAVADPEPIIWDAGHVFDYGTVAVLGREQKATLRISGSNLASTMALTCGLDEYKVRQALATCGIKASLHGEKFSRTKLSTPEQEVPKVGFAEWIWLVTPLKSGTHRLYVRISLCLDSVGGSSYQDLPPWEHVIEVKPNLKYSLSQYWGKHWGLTVTAGITIALFILGKCVPNAPSNSDPVEKNRSSKPRKTPCPTDMMPAVNSREAERS